MQQLKLTELLHFKAKKQAKSKWALQFVTMYTYLKVLR